jgi:hypothetical protein
MKDNVLEMYQNAQGIWAKIEDYDDLGLRVAKMTAKASRMNGETMATKLQDMQDFNAEDLKDLNEETPQEHATNSKLESISQATANLGKIGKIVKSFNDDNAKRSEAHTTVHERSEFVGKGSKRDMKNIGGISFELSGIWLRFRGDERSEELRGWQGNFRRKFPTTTTPYRCRVPK